MPGDLYVSPSRYPMTIIIAAIIFHVALWWVTRIHKYSHKLNVFIGTLNVIIWIIILNVVNIEISGKGPSIAIMIIEILTCCLAISLWIWVSASLITEGVMGKRFRFFHIIDAIHIFI